MKTNKKELYIFGRGNKGQIGREMKTESAAAYRTTPVKINFFQTIESDDCEIAQIALGGNHSAALIV